MMTVTLYDKDTGEFGTILSGAMDDLQASIGSNPFLVGAYNSRTHRYNIIIGEVEEKVVKPYLSDLKAERNNLLENYRWTIMPDSPLANKEEWLNYLKQLQNLLKDITEETTDQVVWPAIPQYIYA